MDEVSYYRAIDLLSRSSGTTILMMQEELGISRRTAYRLMERLEAQGFPLYSEDGPDRKKRWKLQEHFLNRLPNISWPDLKLDRQEVILLNLMLGKESTLEESSFHTTLKALRHKLTQWMESGDSQASALHSSSRYISPIKSGRKCYLGSEQILDDLLRAITARQVCKIRYSAFSRQKEMDLIIHPLRIFEWNRGLYIFCLLEPDLPERLLAIERIKSLTVVDTRFEKPDMDPEELLEKAFTVTWDDPVTVKIQFAAKTAPYVKARRWSADQKFKGLADGSVVLSMTTSGFDDVLHWVLGFGASAKVLEPSELAMAVRGQLEETMSLYQ